MGRKREILTENPNYLSSSSILQDFLWNGCCHIARPNSSGGFSGRQNIYGYFHGIFARNGFCFPTPRGYSLRSNRNSQAPPKEITSPLPISSFSMILDYYFPCSTLDQPTRTLPPQEELKPVEIKHSLEHNHSTSLPVLSPPNPFGKRKRNEETNAFPGSQQHAPNS